MMDKIDRSKQLGSKNKVILKLKFENNKLKQEVEKLKIKNERFRVFIQKYKVYCGRR